MLVQLFSYFLHLQTQRSPEVPIGLKVQGTPLHECPTFDQHASTEVSSTPQPEYVSGHLTNMGNYQLQNEVSCWVN